VPDLSRPLEECLQALKAKENLQEVLRRHPDDRAALVSLLRLSVELNTLGAPSPDPAFRLRARNRMLAVAQQRRRDQQRSPFHWMPRPAMRLAISAACSLALVGAGLITAAAAGTSLPGDPLYGVKLGVERAQLAVTLNASDRARLQLQFANLRLQEAQAMFARGRSQDAMALIGQYDEAVSGFQTSLASAAFDDTSVSELSHDVQQRQHEADASLSALAGSLKAHGDQQSAAIVAQAQTHIDQAFTGSNTDIQAHQKTAQGQSSGHQPKPAGGASSR